MDDKSAKLLLIDDNEIDVKIVKRFLEKDFDTPFKLTIKNSISEGKKTLDERKFDIVLLDVHLPDSTTDQTLEFIRVYEEQFAIIVLSTIHDKQLRLEAIKKGAQDYLVKNEFDGFLLTRAINYAIERHRLHKQLHDYARELKDKENKLTESQAIAHIGNWELNPADMKISWSREALNILEINNGEDFTYLEEFLNHIHPDEQRFVKDIIKQAVDDNRDFNEDIRIVAPKGKIKHVNFRIRSGPAEEGNILKIVGTIQDISSRKEIESALISSEEKYHRLFEDSRDAIYITTDEGRFMDFNHATVELFGYSEDELSNIDVTSLYFNPFEREKLKKAILEKGFVRDFDMKLKRKDGTKLDCLISSTIWRSNDGRVVGFQGIIRDITEKKQAEELLRNKEIAERHTRLKERFLANMSHEIRTPINAISGLTHLLMKTGMTEKQAEFVNGIKTSSEHLLALVNDILDFSKIEAGKIKFESVKFNLKEHIEQIISTLQYTAEQKGLELIFEHDDTIPAEIIGDHIKLNQILINLLSNALKFTEKGSIKMKTRLIEENEDAAVVAMSVTDTGIGIPENKLETIFRSFTQLGRNITKTPEGTGLGLAITKQLVELQGGTIKVESQLDQGTTFEVVLRFRKKLEKAEAEKENKPLEVVDIGSKKFLIVEDKKLNQLVTSEMLKSWWRNIEIDFADNGLKAIERVAEKEYDLILMDVQMPEMDGYDATKHIRNNFKAPLKDVPILAITAYNTTGEAEKCLESGMNDYLAKPFAPNQLYEKVISMVTPSSTKKITAASASKISTSNDALNLSNLNTAAGENEELKNKIIALLLEETPEEVNRLKKVTEEGNWKRVRAVAHKLKSGITYLGLNATLELAKKIEEYAETGTHLDRIPDLVNQVADNCDRAIAELQTTFTEKTAR